MLDLNALTYDAMIEWGKYLYSRYRDKHYSFEGVAQACTQEIYSAFEGQMPLVRIFRITRRDELPSAFLAEQQSTDEEWLVLMGTTGDEFEWNSRHTSRRHAYIPKSFVEEYSPIIQATFRQLNLSWKGGDEPFSAQTKQAMTRCFLVEKVLGSPYIPNQEVFIKPNGIESVIGIGSSFVTGGGFMCFGFSKIPLGLEQAQIFAELTPYLSTLLANYEQHHKLWEPA